MAKKKQILDEISEADAYSILNRLIDEDKELKERVEKIAKEHLSNVDSDDIAEDVFCELDSLDVHDLWDESGSTRDGYVDVDEHAWEMFEERLDLFVDQMKKYQRLKMFPEAKTYCIGILKGLYMFKKDATTEFSDWATDAPDDFSQSIYEEWKKNQPVKEDVTEVDTFMKKEFGDYVP